MAGNWANQDGTLRLKPYLFKRCALLLLAGAVLSCWWAADILHVYALFVALGAWIAGLSIRALGRLTLAAGLFCCAGILASALWLRWFKRGPLEALFHRLAGGRRSKRSRHRTHPVAATLPDQV